MPKIVGIHGIGQQVRGGRLLRDTIWFPNLYDGLVAADRTDVARSLIADDLAVAFWGTFFRRTPLNPSDDELPTYGDADLTSELEVGLLRAWYDAAIEQEVSDGTKASARQAPLGIVDRAVGKVKTYPPAHVMLERLLRNPTFAGRVSPRIFKGNMKQVDKFINEPSTKDIVLERVHEWIDKETVIVIGHSLGSVIAYEYLCRYKPKGVKLLVTLGSPLGIPNLVFHRLVPTPVNQRGAWPGAASMAWVNVAEPRDIVALRKDLAPLFPSSDPLRGVSDRLVDNDEDIHGAGPYLSDKVTGGPIAAAL